jgi:hypothetical protein
LTMTCRDSANITIGRNGKTSRNNRASTPFFSSYFWNSEGITFESLSDVNGRIVFVEKIDFGGECHVLRSRLNAKRGKQRKRQRATEHRKSFLPRHYDLPLRDSYAYITFYPTSPNSFALKRFWNPLPRELFIQAHDTAHFSSMWTLEPLFIFLQILE